jgi:hypothetical protein
VRSSFPAAGRVMGGAFCPLYELACRPETVVLERLLANLDPGVVANIWAYGTASSHRPGHLAAGAFSLGFGRPKPGSRPVGSGTSALRLDGSAMHGICSSRPLVAAGDLRSRLRRPGRHALKTSPLVAIEMVVEGRQDPELGHHRVHLGLGRGAQCSELGPVPDELPAGSSGGARRHASSRHIRPRRAAAAIGRAPLGLQSPGSPQDISRGTIAA